MKRPQRTVYAYPKSENIQDGPGAYIPTHRDPKKSPENVSQAKTARQFNQNSVVPSQTIQRSTSGRCFMVLIATCDVDPDLFTATEPVSGDHLLQHLCCNEHIAFNICEGIRSGAPHVTFFVREFWGSAACSTMSLLVRYCEPRMKKVVRQACVLEACVASLVGCMCTEKDWNQVVSSSLKSKLRAVTGCVLDNLQVMIDYINQKGGIPANYKTEILVASGRSKALKKGDHGPLIKQQNEICMAGLRQLATIRISDPSSLGCPVTKCIEDLLNNLDSAKSATSVSIRKSFLNLIEFESRVPPPIEYDRYTHFIPTTAIAPGLRKQTIVYDPLPPMLPHLDKKRTLLPPIAPLTNAGMSGMLTAVLDLDETLVHFSDGGDVLVRPGCIEFLQKLARSGAEIVIFTAATQDYADWVVDQLIAQGGIIHHRLYRQHAIPWGPIFIKDLSRLGRNISRTVIVDNVQENFMLQPDNGIFILPWYDDPNDATLLRLLPLMTELSITKTVPVSDILKRYADKIPSWAGFDGINIADCAVVNQLNAAKAAAAAAASAVATIHIAPPPVVGPVQSPQPPPPQVAGQEGQAKKNSPPSSRATSAKATPATKSAPVKQALPVTHKTAHVAAPSGPAPRPPPPPASTSNPLLMSPVQQHRVLTMNTLPSLTGHLPQISPFQNIFTMMPQQQQQQPPQQQRMFQISWTNNSTPTHATVPTVSTKQWTLPQQANTDWLKKFLPVPTMFTGASSTSHVSS